MEFEPQLHAVRGWCPKCEMAVSWTKTERRFQRMVQRPVGLRVGAGIEASYVCEKCSYITSVNPDSLEAQEAMKSGVPVPESAPPPPPIDPVVIPPAMVAAPAPITEADLKAQMDDIDARIRRALTPTD